MGRCAYCGFEFPLEVAGCPACGRPLAPPPARAEPPPIPRTFPPPIPRNPPPPGRSASKLPWGVFVAVGCAAAIPLLGILAAIVIPNFLDAVQKAKTKQTMADMRLLGTAIESYHAETGSIPNGESIDELASVLEPTYLTVMPRKDGWQREFFYMCWSSQGGASCDTYRLVSAGRDGGFENQEIGDYLETQTEPGDYDRDIVYGDGMFMQFPGGGH